MRGVGGGGSLQLTPSDYRLLKELAARTAKGGGPTRGPLSTRGRGLQASSPIARDCAWKEPTSGYCYYSDDDAPLQIRPPLSA